MINDRFMQIQADALERANNLLNDEAGLIQDLANRQHVHALQAELEGVTVKVISAEVDALGKPLFPNEALRKAELAIRLRHDDDAQMLTQDEEDLTAKIELRRAQIKYQSRLERWARLEAEMIIALVKTKGAR
jgi:hypothetical protein